MTSALREARIKAGLTIEDIARKLKIRREYLIALEEDDFEKIPGEVYAQGYLKMYSTYLDIDLSKCYNIVSDESSHSWNRTNHLSKYNSNKVIISLFILGILCIFCWHNIADKVESEPQVGLLYNLKNYTPDDNNVGSLLLKKEECEHTIKVEKNE